MQTLTLSLDTVSPITVTATPRLMQNFRVASPIDAGVQTVAVANALGDVELLTRGTDQTITNFYPDPSSDTAYSSAATGLSGSVMAAGRNAAGQLVIFAAQGLILNYVVEINTPTQRWSAPMPLTVPLPTGAKTITAIVVSNMAKDLYVGVLVGFTSAYGAQNAFSYALWSTAPTALTRTTLNISTQNVVWTGSVKGRQD